jgi:hypothetical protein
MAKRKGIPAAAFIASFSSAGRAIAPAAAVGITTVVERWDGQKWVEKQLEWNGTEYKEIN